MKYVKMLGLLAVAAAALMAFAGSASALVTYPAGTAYTGDIEATSTNTELHGTVEIACAHSEVKGSITAGSTTGSISTLHFTKCNREVTTTAGGSLSITSKGTLYSTGARVTVQTTIIGFPVHCIYTTNNTHIGTLTEGKNPAVLHIESAAIPQEATSSLCGDDAEWTGNYTVTKPAGAITVD